MFMGVDPIRKPGQKKVKMKFENVQKSQDIINLKIEKPRLLLQGNPHITEEISPIYQDLFKISANFHSPLANV